jgi:hypothetical protein
MPTDGTIVSALPDRPLRTCETDALEANERLQMVVPERLSMTKSW